MTAGGSGIPARRPRHYAKPARQKYSLSYIAGSLIFGVLGWAAFRRGRSKQDPSMLWGGVGLMVYPYAISQAWLLWTIGVGVTAWLISRWR